MASEEVRSEPEVRVVSIRRKECGEHISKLSRKTRSRDAIMQDRQSRLALTDIAVFGILKTRWRPTTCHDAALDALLDRSFVHLAGDELVVGIKHGYPTTTQ
jgi:hypothetical protein